MIFDIKIFICKSQPSFFVSKFIVFLKVILYNVEEMYLISWVLSLGPDVCESKTNGGGGPCEGDFKWST